METTHLTISSEEILYFPSFIIYPKYVFDVCVFATMPLSNSYKKHFIYLQFYFSAVHSPKHGCYNYLLVSKNRSLFFFLQNPTCKALIRIVAEERLPNIIHNTYYNNRQIEIILRTALDST